MTAKLVDYLQGETLGENSRTLVIFQDIKSIEMGIDFQVKFSDALTRSSVAVLIASHDALERMLKHIPTVEDNVLIEWLCALYLENKIQLKVIPIFIGEHAEVTGDSDDLGINFFEKFPDEALSRFEDGKPLSAEELSVLKGGKSLSAEELSVLRPPSFKEAVTLALKSGAVAKKTIVQLLPDIKADETVRQAVELLKKAEKWDDGDEIDPPSSAFGLTSLTVRTIVTAVTKLNGEFASYQSSESDLLFKTSSDVKKILAGLELVKSVAEGVIVGGNDCGQAVVAPPVGVASEVVAANYAEALKIITASHRALPGKFDELTTYLQEQGIVEGSDLGVQDADVMVVIRGYLNPTGLKLFNKAMGMPI